MDLRAKSMTEMKGKPIIHHQNLKKQKDLALD